MAPNTRTLTNKKGTTLQTSLTDKEAFDILAAKVDDRQASDFENSLVAAGRRFGLSEEQFWWIHKCATPKFEVEIDADKIASKLYQLAAIIGKRKAEIVAKSQDKTVVFKIAGDRSKYCGDIWVLDDREYPQTAIYGRIAQNDHKFRGTDVDNVVESIVRKLNENNCQVDQLEV